MQAQDCNAYGMLFAENSSVLSPFGVAPPTVGRQVSEYGVVPQTTLYIHNLRHLCVQNITAACKSHLQNVQYIIYETDTSIVMANVLMNK